MPLLLVDVGPDLLQPWLLTPQEAGGVGGVEEVEPQQRPHGGVQPGLRDLTVGQQGDLGHDERVHQAAEENNNQDSGRDAEDANPACHH